MSTSGSPITTQRTLLVGTGRAIAELRHLLMLLEPPAHILGCVLPHDEDLQSSLLSSVPVLGRFEELAVIVERQDVDLVLVSFPVALIREMLPLKRQLTQRSTPWQFLPMLTDQLNGRHLDFPGAWMHQVGVATDSSAAFFRHAGNHSGCEPWQLLQRRPRPLDEESISQVLTGRRVLISGAGGSIGSQLALGVAGFKPAKLVLVERSENALFEIDRQIARLHPNLERATVLHDVTDATATSELVLAQTPDVVFHTAAHKHVPMMEEHPAAAVENNFYGTRAIADAAAASGVDRFVMISTDKAVNPSSVMGATKRLAELYIQDLNTRSECVFCMVRFGNVLGSACSVLPIWRQQLAEGGSITVTHPDMYRYFMTIPEAAGLVLQSAALSGGGEVFLLDMGLPVRILDLAHRFLRSYGLVPDVDVPVRITGIRPGEKLFEQLAYDSEDMFPTLHESIRIWRTPPPDAARIRQILSTLDRLRRNDPDGGGKPGHWRRVAPNAVINTLRHLVPEMVSAAAG